MRYAARVPAARAAIPDPYPFSANGIAPDRAWAALEAGDPTLDMTRGGGAR
jgi:hypothetical protein